MRIDVDVGPKSGGLAGGDQFVARAGGGAVHGGFEVRLPVGQSAVGGWVGIARLALLRRQDAADAGQVQRVHPLVLAEGHAGAVASTAVPRQHRLAFAGPLLLGEIAHRAAQAVNLFAERRDVRVQPLTVEVAHLGHFVLNGFQFPC